MHIYIYIYIYIYGSLNSVSYTNKKIVMFFSFGSAAQGFKYWTAQALTIHCIIVTVQTFYLNTRCGRVEDISEIIY